MKIFKKFWPIIFIINLWLIFSSPYFFQHKVPYPSKYQVTFFTPWNQYPEYAGPVKNSAMPDVVDQIYPWKYFTINSLKQKEIPYWNPYSFAGTPHLANYQSAVLSPFNVFFLTLPFLDAWSLLILLQPLLAALFMYLFLKELKLSDLASLLGSVVFMFCGFIVVWMAYGTLSMAIIFLPLALWSIGKNLTRPNLVSILALPLSIAFSFFSGHVQTSFYFFLYLLLYTTFRFFTTRKRKLFLYSILLILSGITVSMLQILPSLALYSQTTRSSLFSTFGAIPFQYLVTLFAPDFYGNPVTRTDWVGFYAEWASFIGIIPTSLAISALFSKEHRKNVLFFFSSALITLLFAIQTPFQEILAALKVPILSTSIPSRIIVLFSFSLIILSAFGLDHMAGLLNKKSKQPLLVFSISLVLIIFIWISLFIFKPLRIEALDIARKNMILPTILIITAVFTIAAKFIRIKKFTIKTGLIIFALLFLASFDSLRFAQKWMPFDERELVFPKKPVIEAMQKNVGQGRVYGDFGSYIDTYFAIPSLEGYDPLYIKRYGEFIRSADKGELSITEKSVVRLERRGKYTDRVLDLLGVNLIYHPISQTNQSWAYPVWEEKYFDKYKIIYSDDKFQLYKNNTALPRAKLFYDFEVINKDSRIIKRFFTKDFDFRNKIILEKDPGIVADSDASGSAKIAKLTSNRIQINTTSTDKGILFLSDTLYYNWRAKINGKNTEIFRADYAFRAVVVPEGNSLVDFYYEP